MTKAVNEYLRQNGNCRICTSLDMLHKEPSKDTPIYITGTYGPQGKSTLLRLLIAEGYTNVMELEDIHNICVNTAVITLDNIKEAVAKRDAATIEEYSKKGIVFSFGNRFLHKLTRTYL